MYCNTTTHWTVGKAKQPTCALAIHVSCNPPPFRGRGAYLRYRCVHWVICCGPALDAMFRPLAGHRATARLPVS